jgi:Inner membrane protein YgaP-like, transmembrane domain
MNFRPLLRRKRKEKIMYIDRLLRLIAGFFIMLSLALAHYHSPNWLWFTGFVGLNLFQSAFTNWCPMMTILEKLGVPKFPASCTK